MRKQFALILAIFSFCLSTVAPIHSQTTSTALPNSIKKRPTVGLVLSGGGARGFAHIGVLKVLEENHVPVDYVGGASMGGLVGALYAMGKTPDEIEKLVMSLSWDRLFQSNLSLQDLSYRRREDRRNIPAPIVLKGNIKDLNLPNALNSGHEIGLLIDRLTLPYAEASNFNDLAIPFRAVGTDMVKGESVTLDHGSLSRSLRATMSVPGVFAPVEVNGRILSDGGLVNNIPTDVVKAMGADIILVVNIETQLGDRKSLESLPGVLAQTISVATIDNSRRSMRQADIIISPDLDKHSATDFGAAKDIITLGYNGAKQKESLLKPLSLNDEDWKAHLAARHARMRPEIPPTPEMVAVDIKNPSSVERIENKLQDKFDDKPLDNSQLDLLDKDLSQLVGTSRFESLDYRITNEKGRTELVIGSTDPTAGRPKPTRLEIGFDVNSIDGDTANFNFLSRLTLFDVGSRGSEWRNDFRLGSNTFLGTEYYRPIGRTGFFIAPRASYERRRLNIWLDNDRVAEYGASNYELAADVGYNFNIRSELRAGLQFGYGSMNRRIGLPVFEPIRGYYTSAGLKWNYDSTDRSQVPTRGTIMRSRADYFFTSPNGGGRFPQAEINIFNFVPYRERNTLVAFGSAGTSFGHTPGVFQQFSLGGLFRVGGYGYEQFRGSDYFGGGIGFLHNPKIIPSFLGGKTYVGGWYEGGSTYLRGVTTNYRQSLTGGVVVETPIGPVFVGGSINENANTRFYFSFGRVFR